MKKKVYVKPEILVVDVEAETLMAASPSSTKASFGDDIIGSGQSVDAKGHDFNVWGDDDED